jgi:glutathione peroxidase
MHSRLSAALTLLGSLVLSAPAAAECPAYLDHEFKRLHSSQQVNLCKLQAGRPMLVVNTASHCGFTGQFRGLEALHREYAQRGLAVVGFPSNDFNQEARDEARTAEICFVNYGVTFAMLAPSPVRGPGANPVFQALAARTQAPSWNFNKYLLSADGETVQHFGSQVAPDAPELRAAIEDLLD